MSLQGKTAVVYGAAGAVGSAICRTFARAGAEVFLAGRTRDTLEQVAKDITEDGGRAHVSTVDALDPQQVEEHVAQVVAATGRLDVCVTAVSIRGDLQGTPLLQMDVEDVLTPVLTAVRANTVTATAAGRRMSRQGSGVILTLSTSASRLSGRDRRFHTIGGFGIACGAVESLTYALAAELGPRGIRVVCLRPDALPETWPDEGLDEDGNPSTVREYMQGGTMLDRLPRLAQVADAAAFYASDAAGAITGTVANLSCGSVAE